MPYIRKINVHLANYLQLLKRLYLLEEVPGWAPPARSKKRFVTKPKRYLADGRWAAIEIKVGEDKVPAAIERLNHLEEKVCSNSRARVRTPSLVLSHLIE